MSERHTRGQTQYAPVVTGPVTYEPATADEAAYQHARRRGRPAAVRAREIRNGLPEFKPFMYRNPLRVTPEQQAGLDAIRAAADREWSRDTARVEHDGWTVSYEPRAAPT
jgi:hypothetical protein